MNLLREGLDIPEVSLVAILDADKEGFLRNVRSLTQTAGRAARNANGKVIMYADRITGSMKKTIDETDRRREKQIAYNIEHHITPKTIYKSKEEIANKSTILDIRRNVQDKEEEVIETMVAAEPMGEYGTAEALDKQIEKVKKAMQKASKQMDFMEAARLRDELFRLQGLL